MKLFLPFLFMLPLIMSPLAWYKICISLTFLLLILTSSYYSFLTGPSYISSYLFMDSLSWPLMMLSIWIFILSILSSQFLWSNSQRPQLFLLLSTLLLLTLLLCFTSSNVLMFYFFFETSLVPTLLLIIIWGYQPERLQAGTYLMLYTISASLPFLLGILLIMTQNGHLNMNLLFMGLPITSPLTLLWSLQLSMAFLVKLPLYSTHLWLPKAHVEAPVAGSMILAGILLKLGVYGLLRFCSMFPMITNTLLILILPISLVGAVMTSLICLRQTDFKSLIAYSSVGHMGLLAGGLFSGFYWGWQGALLMSVAHGLCSSGLFALANMLYLTASTRSLYLIKGLQTYFPIMTLWWFLFSISNMAAPPSLNLLAEIMLITSALATSYMSLMPLALLSFFSAAYSLFLFIALQHGTPSKQMNPLLLTSPNNFIILFLHLTPLIFIILFPNIATSWL
uniref:NADH-ubiquinone oxidoreductase chain 4 n=1 Tax=Phascolosoma pacificum TaxID=1634976 RepID=A0A1D8BER7_9ANNE|nr:NADH dehydrogenase subunit 4 [Phascolosoma pacificum]AOS53044.1 NADH dehydrogenase subunit 4 [Phascolosoma pacificum]